MKYLRFLHDGQQKYGILEGSVIHEINGTMFDDRGKTGKTFDLSGVKVLAPCDPSKYFVIGLNYAAHIAELGMAKPDEPVVLLKAPTSIVGQDEPIVIANPQNETHYEGELAVVIGKLAKKVGKQEALDYVLGYTIGNDVSDRVVQKRDVRWMRAKSFDTYGPLGPVVETEVDPTNLTITTRVNGQVKQHSNSGDMVFSVADLVSFISSEMTLLPGDVILTGTPGGVGPIRAGDVVEITIDRIGTLRNPVTA